MRNDLPVALRRAISVSLATLVASRIPVAVAGPVTTAPPKATDTASAFPKRSAARPGAPNVLLIMTDDVGFGASSTFGGPIPTPTFSALASHGVRYNEFHTTAMCSPTRAALLTGRNPHMVNMGSIVELAYDHRGYTSVIPRSAATIGQVLSLNGYDTAWIGKDHVTPEWDITPLGPFGRWPNGLGFGYFYGFLEESTDQFAPSLVENRNVLPRKINQPHYILDHDLASHAVHWLEMQHTLHPHTPFFLYYAPGSTHAPHQAPTAWINRFDGRFTEGWDEMREETFARQKRMGIIPKDAVLTPRPPEIPAWRSMSPQQRKVAVRLMQVYAGMLAYSDNQIGRIISYLRKSGQFGHTLIIFIQGDNGASSEGTIDGTLDKFAFLSGINLDLGYMVRHLAEAGGPKSFENYPVGWAWAMDTPFQWMKTYAGHLGGIRNDLVISWPHHMTDVQAMRQQFHDVIDIAPTIYQAAGITPPRTVSGVKQMPIQGVSMLYTLAEPDAPSRRREQYFETAGNRALYKDGWMASTTPQRFLWLPHRPAAKATDYKWELYDLRSDYSQSRNLAARFPGKLRRLRHDFLVVARRNHVLPIHGNLGRTLALSSRPYVMNGRRHFTFHQDGFLYGNAAFPDITNRSWRLSATVEIPAGGARGTVIGQGDYPCGWGLFFIEGRPTFIYKTTPEPRDLLKLVAPHPLAAGRHVVSVRFIYQGRDRAGAATVTLFVDGQAVSTGRIARTVGGRFPEVGSEVGRTVAPPLIGSYQAPFAYNGKIDKVTIDLSRPD